MRKVNVYVDWFNLYHRLRTYWYKYYWLDLIKLCNHYIDPNKQKINTVYFFTALPIWDSSKEKRHKLYIDALQSSWVKIRLWKFQRIKKRFNKRSHEIFIPERITILKKILYIIRNLIIYPRFAYFTHEEKETDVNISVQILEDAVLSLYDDAIIISWDSDIKSAIVSVKKLFPNVTFTSVLPIWWQWKQIKQICAKFKVMNENQVKSSLFPDKIVKWNLTIEKPIHRK